METKEAINNAIETIKYYNRMYYDAGHTEDLDEVIELLRRGEKFKKMIDKMYRNKYGAWVDLPDSYVSLSDFICDVEREVKS